IIDESNTKTPVHEIFHRKLIDYLKVFLIIGGMPEVLASYIEHRDILRCQTILDEIILTTKDDFAKYKKRSPVIRLNEVFDAVSYQTGSKFKYANIDASTKSVLYKDSLDLLVQAGLTYKIFHTSAQGIPITAQINLKKFKVILLDIGIHQRTQKNDVSSIIVSDDFNIINKGYIAEAFVGTELLKSASPVSSQHLCYWHRESKSSNAEIDYVIQVKDNIFPIEVKAGTKGQMQSMNIFLQERQMPRGIRISLENFNQYENIDVIPLYAVRKCLLQ
ncbi:DUF4143 domain-containing protein, partial [Candidatus Margulisiibacteriota bacterium]